MEQIGKKKLLNFQRKSCSSNFGENDSRFSVRMQHAQNLNSSLWAESEKKIPAVLVDLFSRSDQFACTQNPSQCLDHAFNPTKFIIFLHNQVKLKTTLPLFLY